LLSAHYNDDSAYNNFRLIVTHELGHSFGRLRDEYWAGSGTEAWNMTSQTITPQSNPIWHHWIGYDGIGKYAHTGHSNWFRPTDTPLGGADGMCHMGYLSYEFCAVCSTVLINYMHAFTGKQGYLYDLLSPVNARITGLSSGMNPRGRIIIPSRLIPAFNDGRTVTEIGNSAFENQTGISAATIPDTVTRVRNNAFSNTGVWANTANNSAVYAGSWAVGFRGTVNSSSGELTLRTNTAGIGDGAFSQVSGLREAKMPGSVKSIGAAAFSNNPNLNRVWMPSSVTVIDSNAFAGCPSLTIYAQAASRPTGWNVNWNPNNCPVIWNSPEAYKQPINQRDIPGVALPVTGAVPVTTITETSQYAGTVTWSPNDSAFKAGTFYTATITLAAKPDYTLHGVALNSFRVSGTTMTKNPANSGVVTAEFPAIISEYAIRIGEPMAGEMPATDLGWTIQTAGASVTWKVTSSGAPHSGPFAVTSGYTATVNIVPRNGYTLHGVPANYFTVEGASSTSNDANSGIVTAAFTGVWEALAFIEFGFDEYEENYREPEMYINKAAKKIHIIWPYVQFSGFPAYPESFIKEWWDSGDRELLLATFSGLSGNGVEIFIGNGITFEGETWGNMSSTWPYSVYPDLTLKVANNVVEMRADFNNIDMDGFLAEEINRVHYADFVVTYTGNLY
jgi:hypothetical protein